MIRDDERFSLIIYDAWLEEHRRFSISPSVSTRGDFRHEYYCLYKDRVFITRNDYKSQLEILVNMSCAKAVQSKLESLRLLHEPPPAKATSYHLRTKIRFTKL